MRLTIMIVRGTWNARAHTAVKSTLFRMCYHRIGSTVKTKTQSTISQPVQTSSQAPAEIKGDLFLRSLRHFECLGRSGSIALFPKWIFRLEICFILSSSFANLQRLRPSCILLVSLTYTLFSQSILSTVSSYQWAHQWSMVQIFTMGCFLLTPSN